MTFEQNCPYCRFLLTSVVNFCPHCGKRLTKEALSTGFLKQAVLYLASFFLTPFGLWWAFKYLRQDDKKAKKIGLIIILLTIVSLALAFWLSKTVVKNINQSIKEQTELLEMAY